MLALRRDGALTTATSRTHGAPLKEEVSLGKAVNPREVGAASSPSTLCGRIILSGTPACSRPMSDCAVFSAAQAGRSGSVGRDHCRPVDRRATPQGVISLGIVPAISTSAKQGRGARSIEARRRAKELAPLRARGCQEEHWARPRDPEANDRCRRARATPGSRISSRRSIR